MVGQPQVVVGCEIKTFVDVILRVFDGDFGERNSNGLAFFKPKSILLCLSDVLISGVISSEEVDTLGVSAKIEELLFGMKL